jgi:drug/metabolite transporter (DMT)-like permease
VCIFAYRKGTPIACGIFFGLFAGGMGGLDPFFKGMGQTLGTSPGFFPSSIDGWFIYLGSFLFGTVAFLLTQWGFARKSPASVLVPCYNSFYVIIPIMLYGVALPGYNVTPITIIGMILTVVGIILMQGFKKSNSKLEKEEKIFNQNEK